MGVARHFNRKRAGGEKLQERHGELFEACDEEDIVINREPKRNRNGQEEEQELNPNSSRELNLKGASNRSKVALNKHSANGHFLNPHNRLNKQCLNPGGSKNGQQPNSKTSKQEQNRKPENCKKSQCFSTKSSKKRSETADSKALPLDGDKMDTSNIKVKKDGAGGEVLRVPPKVAAGSLSVYLADLDPSIQKIDIKRFFKGCHIDNMHLAIDRSTSRFRGYAHVDFCDDKSLEKAIKMDQKQLLGRPVRISCAALKGYNAKLGCMESR